MSFQAYIDNIRAKTGKTPEQLKEAVEKAGVYHSDMKATELVNFLATEFDLGHGHSMAIWAYFKNKGWVMNQDILAYNNKQAHEDKLICDKLHGIISKNLPQAQSKVWHAHPVWFLNGNPIVGYSKLKNNVRLMFWSGQSFDEPKLIPSGSFKAAEVIYTDENQIKPDDLKRYLKKAVVIQWDYKNIIKNRGLLRLK